MMASNTDGQRFGKTLIFAHRGANREAMENTRAAFNAALNYPIDGIETDVQLSRDEVAVLWHDQFLDKIGLPDKHIDDFDYAQLNTLDFPQTSSEGLMTLKRFLSDYHQRCRLLIEVKNHDWEPVFRHQLKMLQVTNLVNATMVGDFDDRTMVSSFNLSSLIDAHRQTLHIPFIYNLDDDQTANVVQQTLNDYDFLYGYCLPIAMLDQHLVDLLRTHEKCIAVYTCNTDEEIDRALQLGVDILISDLPYKALGKRDNIT